MSRGEFLSARSARRTGTLFALLLLGLALFRPVPAAAAIDLEKEVSLAVTPGSPTQVEELKSANLVLDIYQVAAAQPMEGYDTYEFVAKEVFADLGVENRELTTEDWTGLAFQAADLVLKGEVAPVAQGVSAEEPVELPEAGLYLLLARGSDLEEYVTEVSGHIATLAQNETQVFTYNPELVAVPGKAAVSGVINTANPGEWLYEVPVTLKPVQDTRKSAIRIVKTLDIYEDSQPANFVFRVEATLGGETVRSDVVALTMTSAGTESVEIDNLPVGAEVVISEDYPGANYKLVSDQTQTVTVQATEIAEAEFENTYDETHKNGGIIINHFEHDEADGWGWTKVEE